MQLFKVELKARLLCRVVVILSVVPFGLLVVLVVLSFFFRVAQLEYYKASCSHWAGFGQYPRFWGFPFFLLSVIEPPKPKM